MPANSFAEYAGAEPGDQDERRRLVRAQRGPAAVRLLAVVLAARAFLLMRGDYEVAGRGTLYAAG